MQVVSFPARPARTHYRHELRALTYVTLDAANGGIIRNLNRAGLAVQAVAPLRQQQRVRVRFELRFPRLRVETYGHVSWSSPSGQCGIRFVDLPDRTGRQIDEWIFSNLLDTLARDGAHSRPILESSPARENVSEPHDGLTLSAPPRPAIRLEPSPKHRDEIQAPSQPRQPSLVDLAHEPDAELNWLSRPLSLRTLAWLVDSLVVIAGLLLFALIFLSIAHELPPWPVTLGAAVSAALFVAAAYWVLFAVFGGTSLGSRLAQTASSPEEEETSDGAGRFR